MYSRHDCLFQDGTEDGAKAWCLLQQCFANVEKPAVVSLVRQMSRLLLGQEEKIHEYYIRSQELMSRPRLAKSTSKSPEFAIHTGQQITN